MQYRQITNEDAHFLTEIFSISEYDMYFAENDASEDDWKERITTLYQSMYSLIVSDNGRQIGWIMYSIEGDICSISIIVLLPQERFKGYGKNIFSDLLAHYPGLKTIKLDVQQRNKTALAFYRKLGFVINGEEIQTVKDENVPYYNLMMSL